MATGLNLHINHSSSDLPLDSSGVDWIEVDPSNDKFIFSDGSADVADGEAIPNEAELNRAGVELDGGDAITVSKYFLADDSENELSEIFLASDNARYVFCAEFDGATATEPQLEAWDNLDMNSYTETCLGLGTPNISWYKAICTTDGLSGSEWSGTALAGSGASNIILLNNGSGALITAKNLYFNLKIVIPSGWETPGSFTPIIAVTYTTN